MATDRKLLSELRLSSRQEGSPRSPNAGAQDGPPRGASPNEPSPARSSDDLESASGSVMAVEEGDTESHQEINTLVCSTMRDRLTPRPSPLQQHNNHGGGFVDDGDRVSLVARKFASCSSAGAKSQDSFFLQRRFSTVRRHESTVPPLPPEDKDQQQHQAVAALSPAPSAAVAAAAAAATGCRVGWSPEHPLWAVRAGPRETVYFNAAEVNAAVVTCGGLCPGLNDVVRGIVQKLADYGVPEGNIVGIKYGFRGFYDRRAKPVSLTHESVANIHLQGGTVLGSSRGGNDVKEVVKRLDIWGIDMLFVVGGNGGNAGALAIHRECRRSGVQCAVVGVPKSIDNDIQLIDKCFGFDTAVQEAQRALMAAKVEATSALRGVGLVKLMGRQSGFIAVQASLASGLVDVCLIPEVHFKLEGPHGLFAYLERIMERQGHCVICVAEGAGQDILQEDGDLGRDASGNPILKDVGSWLKKQLKAKFADYDVKYIDPSYMIRSVEPIATDRVYCKLLSHGAVHAAFAGYTGVTLGLINTHYVIMPISAVVKQPRTVDPGGSLWGRLRGATGQPDFF